MGEAVVLLDGGMGRELMRMGAPFRQPEWSALALIEAPDFVTRAHRAYADAGADVITTNSYALVPFHIGEERFRREGGPLAALAGRLARQVADHCGRPLKVAGSLPPLFGSYRPDLFDPAQAPAMLALLVTALRPHVDLWLAETQGSIAEVEAVRSALGDDPRPLWLSFTLADGVSLARAVTSGQAGPTLRSGEPVAAAARAAARLGAEALLFNCSQAEIMEAAVREAAATLAAEGKALRIGVYANAFVPEPSEAERLAANDGFSLLREDLDAPGYLRFARRWIAAGASIVGGCCGIGPEHIAEMAARLDRTAR